MDYPKLTFRLSVFGFIASIGFYLGVLRELKPTDDKIKIEQLTQENERLENQVDLLMDKLENKKDMKKKIVYLDLFSGTGGFALGLKQAGYKFDKHYFSEVDKYAIANYQHNFNKAEHVGAIENIHNQKIERPNIITFGSPCQNISVSGNNKGLQGEKSKLFFNAIKAIERFKPDSFIFENVRNLFSTNGGKDFETVLRSIAKIGLYDCQWELVNSSRLLPQNRERIYLVGHLAKKGVPKIFPLQVNASANEKTEQRPKKSLIEIGKAYKSKQSGRVYSSKGKSPTLQTDVTHFLFKHKGIVRRLTPVEAERAQGFPDDWTKYGVSENEVFELSNTQRYSLVGNAVSPPIIRLIGKKNQGKNYKSLQAVESMNGMKDPESIFIQFVQSSLSKGDSITRLKLEKKGRELGITDKRRVKELTEFSVLKQARNSIENKDTYAAYQNLIDLYKRQPNSSYRSSQVAIMRQYSTPLPISFLLGRFVDGNNPKKEFLEPSAGNGLLTIGLIPENTHVNELDSMRYSVLKRGGYDKVTNFDAHLPMKDVRKNYDGVVSNPPFGRLHTPILYQGLEVGFMDQLMILRALEAMKDDGRAAFVTGKHLRFDKQGRITKSHGRYFFNKLYSDYNVVDMIPIDGSSLYARQGTGFDTMLILIDGRKEIRTGFAPTQSTFDQTVVKDFETLYQRISKHFAMRKKPTTKELDRAKELIRLLRGEELGAPYVPTSDSCNTLDTEVPDTMAYEMHEALEKIEKKVGGDIDNYVRHRLGYSTKMELCKYLAAEQIDAVGMAIYNLEAKGQGCIIGDQTGIGKGRVAAAMIRYANKQGLLPIFLTEKANLFSDIYRDLSAIGSGNLKPFIVNSKESKTNIKDEYGKVVYTAPSKSIQQNIFETANLDKYDVVLATYSQFNSAKKTPKKEFLQEISKDQLVVMDESHNASGSSNTGLLIRKIVSNSKSTTFLSATFAKRPDNMPLYALKTSISDANMGESEFIGAVGRGGVALQEILASQLVAEGQMIRRERSYENVKVDYEILHDKRDEHFAIANNVTQIMRDIIAFQRNYIEPLIEEVDKAYAKENKEVRKRGGTSELGISNMTYFSKVFNVINQMLFAIKAEAVAERAIEKIREGKKPIIAFSSTMGSFLQQVLDEEGIRPNDGSSIKTDFALILKNGLNGVMRYTETDAWGKKSYGRYEPNDLGMDGRMEYWRILGHIEDAVSGIYISPIDIVLDKIRRAGYSAQEVTGRTIRIDYSKDYRSGEVKRIKKVNVNDAFSDFNNNETDVLLINQSGSTGASAHAIVTPKVPLSEVKPRVMIVLQFELNIDTEVQKRGRIFRTGQVHQPEYLYLNSAIPAEQRLMMMLAQKLKSLDANTSSNQNQNEKMMRVPDFLNKYGDRIVQDYLNENGDVYDLLGRPPLDPSGGDTAARISGRMAVLSTDQQSNFYETITNRYLEYIDYLKQTGEYDLELEELDFQAKTLSKKIVVAGNGGNSKFGTDTYLEKLEVNALKKPFKATELRNIIEDKLKGMTPEQYRDSLIDQFDKSVNPTYESKRSEIEAKYDKLLEELPKSKKMLDIWKKYDESAYEEALTNKQREIAKTKREKLSAFDSVHNLKVQTFYGLVKYFTVGRVLKYQISQYVKPHYAVCLGVDISEKENNPYAPSAMKVNIAVASHLKSLKLPGSYTVELNSIKGASMDIPTVSLEQMYRDWQEEIETKSHDRIIRYMRTGNLVQGFSQGRLVSYTTVDGRIEKGILLPPDYDVKDIENDGVTVPLPRASSFIRSLVYGKLIELSGDITLTRTQSGYQMRVPASQSKGGSLFMDEKLIALTEQGYFEKVSNTMRAEIEEHMIGKVIDHLHNEHGVNITLTQSQFERIKDEVQKQISKVKSIKLPPKEKEFDFDLARARALTLKLNLLKLQRARA